MVFQGPVCFCTTIYSLVWFPMALFSLMQLCTNVVLVSLPHVPLLLGWDYRWSLEDLHLFCFLIFFLALLSYWYLEYSICKPNILSFSAHLIFPFIWSKSLKPSTWQTQQVIFPFSSSSKSNPASLMLIFCIFCSSLLMSFRWLISRNCCRVCLPTDTKSYHQPTKIPHQTIHQLNTYHMVKFNSIGGTNQILIVRLNKFR